jgi:hypothetical protein
MLTPLQKLIQKLKSLDEMNSYGDVEMRVAYETAITMAEELIPEEERVIIETYEDGMNEINNALYYLPRSGKEYYDQNFKK